MKISKTHKVLISILLGIILTGLSCKREISSTAVANKIRKTDTTISIANDRTITIYYFHTTYRCYSCTKIEELTKEALKNNFQKQLQSKKIVFKKY